MARLLTFCLLLSITVSCLSLFSLAFGEDPQPATEPEEHTAHQREPKILPLVIVQPGETKELLLSMWCTVDITRGGGLGLTEMRDGKPLGTDSEVKTYSRDGVTMTVPDFEQGVAFAKSEKFALLEEHDLHAFKVTIEAAEDAKPGLMEMHLIDSTCSGRCETDFRVLVVE
ncbi:hypothetical protein [Aeoliella sp.]|uniref:hypothetical protein n=1 Tax=Aeoliella sp. TaxID=2795800 RepID=UPI003CCBFAF1